MGFIRRRGVGMVIEGRRCDIDHFDLLLQIIEVDLGLEVPAPRPKSRLSLKRSRPGPPPPPIEVTPPRPTPRPISQRVRNIGQGLRRNWPQRVVDPRKVMRAPSYGPTFFPLRMPRIDVSIIFVGFFLLPLFCPHATQGVYMAFFLAGLHWPLDKTTTATPQCAPRPSPFKPRCDSNRGGARS